jgi:hypothetical protein
MHNNYVKRLVDMVNINESREKVILPLGFLLACVSIFISAAYGSQGQCGRKYHTGAPKPITSLELGVLIGCNRFTDVSEEYLIYSYPNFVTCSYRTLSSNLNAGYANQMIVLSFLRGGGETGDNPLAMSATLWPLYQPRMADDEHGAIGVMSGMGK